MKMNFYNKPEVDWKQIAKGNEDLYLEDDIVFVKDSDFGFRIRDLNNVTNQILDSLAQDNNNTTGVDDIQQLEDGTEVRVEYMLHCGNIEKFIVKYSNLFNPTQTFGGGRGYYFDLIVYGEETN